MDEGIKFSWADLKIYWMRDFALGKDFEPTWDGDINEKRERDFLGHPALKEAFADHMDRTSHGLRVPYQRMAAIYDGMYRADPETITDERLAYFHKTITWWAFQRRTGVTTEVFAERMNVHERTVRKWLAQALRHIEKELTAPVLIFPSSYHALEAKAGQRAGD